MSAHPSRRRSQLQMLAWFVASFAIGVASMVDWTALDRETAPAVTEPKPASAAPPAAPVVRDVAPAPARAPRTAEPRPSALASAPTKLSVDSELDGHPHPITAEHVRIQRELALIQQLNDALDLRDAPHLRALIAQYIEHVPDDPNALAAGYERIADCLEHPDEASRERAREYYLRERASTLRRYVRRVCFDGAPVESASL
jgi:hypothetical protein